MSGTATPREDILKNIERHDQAGGHAGVMRSGSLIIKPCTQAEIDFYALANETQPLFAQWMPTYMGQLTLNKPGEGSVNAILESDRFEQAIVLENLEWGFKRPSVVDIKLGKILTDEYVSEEKRIRLEKDSMRTTSWESHMRLTGMRVYILLMTVTDVGLGSISRTTYHLPKTIWKIVNNIDAPQCRFSLLCITDKSNAQASNSSTINRRHGSHLCNVVFSRVKNVLSQYIVCL